MTAEPTTPLTLTSPAETVAAIPYLLGYVPRESIVAIALTDVGTVHFILRADAPHESDIRPWAADLAQRLQLAGVDGKRVVLVAFEADDSAREAAFALAEVFAGLGSRIIDRLAAGGGRWWSLECSDEQCCPSGGHPIDEDVIRRMASVFPNQSVQASREDLESELQPAPDDAREGVSEHLRHVPPVDEAARDVAIAHALDVMAGRRADPRDVAMLLQALRDLRVRDTVLWDLLHSPPAAWREAIRGAVDAARRAPDGDVAPIATLLAILWWQCGDGTRASIALDRARRDDPEYSLAALIAMNLAVGMHPREWLEALDGLTREECRRSGVR